MLYASLTLFPLFLVGAFFFLGSTKNGGTVPGASDNLAACAICLAVARFLKNHPKLLPPDTEIRFLFFGAEESGCRGSRAYVRRHLAELRSKNTMVCNMDTIFDPRIWIFTSDRNGTLANSREIISELTRAAEQAGVPHKTSPFPFFGGGTDTMPFGEKNIKAATLYSMKVPSQMVRFYHTPRDSYHLFQNPEQRQALGNTLAICLEWLRSKS
jgi:Zn-dependent M28 family amino/carboxypeptidase